MPNEKTIPQLRKRHARETKEMVRQALVDNDWRCIQTAEALGIRPSSLRSLVSKSGLADEYSRKVRPPGHPFAEDARG